MNKKFLTMGLAALMLAGCSSDDIVNDGGQGGTSTGTGYVGFTLQLPVSKSGRATGDFEEATDNENAVKTLKILFLDNENKILQVADINGSELYWTDDKGNGIGTVAQTPVIEVESNEKCNVVVLINSEDVVADPVKGNTFNAADVNTADMAKLTGEGKAFFMSNAVLANSTTTPTGTEFLVSVTPQTSKAAAQAEAGKNLVYVERAVAKVSVSNTWGEKGWTYTIGGENEYGNSTVEIQDWKLDVTNKYFYPIRQFDNGWFAWNNFSNRFFEETATPARVYFAKSPYYNDYNAGAFNVLKDMGDAAALDKPQYCTENTFDVQHMQHRQTTRALFKAVYTPSKVMKKAESGNYELTETAITAPTTWYQTGNSSSPWLMDDLCSKIQDILGATDAVTLTGADVAGSHPFANSGNVNVIKVGNNAIGDEDLQKVQAALGELTTYAQGVCYYQTRIRHFGDDVTPWGKELNAPFNMTLNTSYVDYVAEYGKSDWQGWQYDCFYLGRYGVVRNNYYELELNTISSPGAPTISDLTPGTETDDIQKYYIQATIKILDWAKHKQSVDL